MNHRARDAAGGALYDDSLRADLLGDLLCRLADASAENVLVLDRVALYIVLQRLKFAVLLRLGADVVERADALEGIFARSRFTGQHNSAGAVVYGVRDIADLSTGRTRVGSHALEHLGSRDDVLALRYALADKSLLDLGQLDEGNLNAHVASSDHDTVGVVHDQIHVVNAALVLDLRDYFNVLVADTVNEVAERAHILVISYK